MPYFRHTALKLLQSRAAITNASLCSSTVLHSHDIGTHLFFCIPLFYHKSVYDVLAHLFTMILLYTSQPPGLCSAMPDERADNIRRTTSTSGVIASASEAIRHPGKTFRQEQGARVSGGHLCRRQKRRPSRQARHGLLRR